MYELGLLGEFQPHQKLAELDGVINGQTVPIADFSRLPTHCKFIAFMPQWDFLNFISSRAKRFPSFELRMEHEVTDLVTENDRVAGVRAKTPDGELDLRAILSLARMGAVPRSATGPASTCANSVCRSTCFGCESPNAWRIRNKHSVFFGTANSSSCSTAAITGNVAT